MHTKSGTLVSVEWQYLFPNQPLADGHEHLNLLSVTRPICVYRPKTSNESDCPTIGLHVTWPLLT